MPDWDHFFTYEELLELNHKLTLYGYHVQILPHNHQQTMHVVTAEYVNENLNFVASGRSLFEVADDIFYLAKNGTDPSTGYKQIPEKDANFLIGVAKAIHSKAGYEYA